MGSPSYTEAKRAAIARVALRKAPPGKAPGRGFLHCRFKLIAYTNVLSVTSAECLPLLGRELTPLQSEIAGCERRYRNVFLDD
jgi:hypothetical protein